MALVDTTWYVNFGNGTSTGYYAVTVRPQNTAVAAGVLRRQFTTPSVGNERVFVCIVAGTTANTTDATWTLTRGAKTTDGTATWQEVSGQSALNGDLTNTATWAQVKAATPAVLGQIIKRSSGASYQICTTAGAMSASEPSFSDTAGVTTTDTTAVWTSLGAVGNFTGGQAPHARLANALASTWFASGNTVYVGDNHAETFAGSLIYTTSSAALAKILCHNHSGSYPPAASDITTGAVIESTATGFRLSPQGSMYFYGITFKAPSNSSAIGGNASITQVQDWYYFDNCSFQVAGVGVWTVGSGAWLVAIFNNTTFKFGSTSGHIRPQFVQMLWQDTGQILAAGSSVPTTLVQMSINANNRFNNLTFKNLDLSQLTGSIFNNTAASSIGTLTVQDCKLNAAMTVTTPINSGMTVQLIRSDSAATACKSTRYQYEGTETTETSIVRTGGAVDPTGIAQSRKIVTSANAQWLRPFKAEPMAIYNTTVGSSVTATVCGTVNADALPNNDDIWAEFEYLGTSGNPLGVIVTTTKSSVLATNAAVASDSSTWNVTYATFDGTPVNTTVSNGGLTATHTTTTSNSGVPSSNAQTSGKFYFEATLVVTHGNFDCVGICRTDATWANIVTDGFNCTMIYKATGNIYSNDVNSTKTLGAIAAGDVISVAMDLTVRLGWFRKNGGNWNGDAAANPATGTGGVVVEAGTVIPIVGFGGGGTATSDQITANFGQSSYAYAVPAGFSSWGAAWSPFKLVATLTPQLPGYIHARVRTAKISTTYYIDPKITLT